jgi:hypothetical protein
VPDGDRLALLVGLLFLVLLLLGAEFLGPFARRFGQEG